MPAISALSFESWAEVRKAYEMGVDLKSLSEKYEVEFGTIRKRIQREKWTTFEEVQAKAVSMRRVRDESLGLSSNVPKGLEVAAETLLANGEQGSVIASNLVLGLLKRANLSPDKLAPITDVYDLTAGLKVVRLAAGMDKASAANVSVNLAMFSGEEKGWTVSGEQDESQ